MNDARLDTRTAAAVNKGLATALMVDVQTGVKMMSKAGVPLEVAMRIFLNPQQHRASDWKRE
jgi:hypothetical protein